MTVLNPNDNFSGKRSEDLTGYKFTKYGEKNVSNVKWTYDFTPLKKWALFILSACFVGALGALLIGQRQKIEQQKEIAIEAQDARKYYLQKILEDVKQQTIAEERRKSMATENTVVEPAKQQQPRGKKLYSWVNENGQTVYSNKPKPE